MKVGDKVKILRKDVAGLNHQDDSYGTITNINGFLILVLPE